MNMKKKNGIGNAHPALYKTVLQPPYSFLAVSLMIMNICINLTLRV
jgi:hypothetical protein